MERLPGRKILKVLGILYVVFGAIVLVSNLIGQGAFAWLGLINGVWLIAIGTAAIRNCNRKENARTLRTLGVVALGFAILGAFLTNIIFAILDLIIPILFIHGANLNIKAGRVEQDETQVSE